MIKFKKKAFEVGKIFIYILALLVMAFILFYSYKSINNILLNKERADYAIFEAELENNINTAARNPGNVLYPSMSVPSYVQKVCFGDFEQGTNITNCLNFYSQKYNDKLFDKFMCDAWKDETKNVFLLPEKPGIGDAIKINLISLNEPIVCMNVMQGSVEIKLTGKGKKALIEIPE